MTSLGIESLQLTETGLDKLSKVWRHDPPPEPLDSLQACAREFVRLFGDQSERDPVALWTAKAETWVEAVDRACRSKDESGKHYNHQSRIPMATLLEFRNRIGAESAFWSDRWNVLCTFDWLHDRIEEIAEDLDGIGPVTTYDVALRLSHWLDKEPQSLYLHAGVREGARAIGLRVRGRDRIGPEELNDEIGDVIAELDGVDMLEDFLCCFRLAFPYVIGDDDVDWG